MRFATPLIATTLALWDGSVRAQAPVLGRPPFLGGQPSFAIRFGAAPISGLLAQRAGIPSFSLPRRSAPLSYPTAVYTCPMPVAHTDSANQDPMPVARGGTPVPMPVVKPECSNPLDRPR